MGENVWASDEEENGQSQLYTRAAWSWSNKISSSWLTRQPFLPEYVVVSESLCFFPKWYLKIDNYRLQTVAAAQVVRASKHGEMPNFMQTRHEKSAYSAGDYMLIYI